jgi:hypothetical protein
MRCKAELPVAGTLLLRRTGSVRVPKDVVVYVEDFTAQLADQRSQNPISKLRRLGSTTRI